MSAEAPKKLGKEKTIKKQAVSIQAWGTLSDVLAVVFLLVILLLALALVLVLFIRLLPVLIIVAIVLLLIWFVFYRNRS